jgi:hypothetical protein
MSSSRITYSVPLLLFLLFGCAQSHIGGIDKTRIWIADRIYFGREIPSGGTVSDSAWNIFLRKSVTPRFPDGLTVWRAEGQWRDSIGNIIQEQTFVLELFYDESPDKEKAVQEIINEYKNRFKQEAVLRTRGIAEVTIH